MIVCCCDGRAFLGENVVEEILERGVAHSSRLRFGQGVAKGVRDDDAPVSIGDVHSKPNARYWDVLEIRHMKLDTTPIFSDTR